MGNHVLVKSTLARIYAVGVILLVASLMFVFSCTGPTPSSAPATTPATSEVIIAGFAFTPATLNIPAGTTVTWRNNDSATHTVTARDNSFDSGSLSRDGSFSFTFKQKGTFEYHCQIHPSMTGKVIVK